VSTHALRQFYRLWLPAALVLAILGNLVASGFLPASAQAFRRHDSGSLTHLVHTEQRSVNLRYGIYMELADALAGGVLFVPEGSALNADLARGLSNVTVKERDYDPGDLSADLVPADEPLGRFEADDEELPYWFLSGDNDLRWWLGHTPEGLVIIPESVAPVPEAGS